MEGKINYDTSEAKINFEKLKNNQQSDTCEISNKIKSISMNQEVCTKDDDKNDNHNSLIVEVDDLEHDFHDDDFFKSNIESDFFDNKDI